MQNFTKDHLRDPNNHDDLRAFHHSVLKEYILFVREFFQSNYDGAVKFLIWLKQYLSMFKNEKHFQPSFLPRYERGQIVLVNLGHRIGYELGGPHYCIVLDADNRKKSGLLTVVPMISKKKRHLEQGLRPWEYDLGDSIHEQIANKAQSFIKLSQQLTDNSTKYHTIITDATELEDSIARAHKIAAHLKKRAPGLAALADKMSKGSVVETQQLITISKQRIIVPTKHYDPLYNIRISWYDMEQICSLISKQYLEDVSLDK